MSGYERVISVLILIRLKPGVWLADLWQPDLLIWYLVYNIFWLFIVNNMQFSQCSASVSIALEKVVKTSKEKEQLPNLNQPRFQHACGYYYNGNNLVKLLINTLYYCACNFLRCIWWLGVTTRAWETWTVPSCWPRVPLPGSTVGCCHRLDTDWGLPHWTTDWLSLVDKSPMMIQWCSLVILGGSSAGFQILEWEQSPGQWKRLQRDLKQSISFHATSIIKIKDVIDSINCT